MDKYFWSYRKDEDLYSNSSDTIEECIEEANKDNYMGADVIYIGELEQYVPHVYAGDLIDRASEAAYDECGECSENWLENIKPDEEQELEKKLNEVFNQWMEEHGRQALFGKVVNVKAYSLNSVNRLEGANKNEI